MILSLAPLAAGQAAVCPDGKRPVDGRCAFEMNGSGKQEMLERLMDEGADGPTHRQAVQYMEKVLGKDATAKLNQVQPQEEETTDSWLHRLKAWVSALTGE